MAIFSTVLAQDLGADPAKLNDLEGVFGNIVSVILALAGVVLFLVLVSGGYKYITAGSNPQALEGAKKTITYAILGIVFIAMAFLIIRVIETITGVNLSEFTIVN